MNPVTKSVTTATPKTSIAASSKPLLTPKTGTTPTKATPARVISRKVITPKSTTTTPIKTTTSATPQKAATTIKTNTTPKTTPIKATTPIKPTPPKTVVTPAAKPITPKTPAKPATPIKKATTPIIPAKKPIVTPSKPKTPSAPSSAKHAYKPGTSTNKPVTSGKPQGLTLNEKLGKGATASTAKSTTSQASSAIKDSFKLDASSTPPEKPAYTPPPVYHDEGIGCIGPLLGLLGLILMFSLLYWGYKKLANKSSTKKANATELVNDNGTSSDDATNTSLTEDSGQEEEGSSALSDNPESCIIITGVFSAYENVSKMESLLEDRGYNVYLEEYGPYTRVGFEYDCSQENMVDYLQNIRTTIPSAEKAWYLQPDFYVEYE